ncbi:MAG TPA: hypothetical protein VF195_13735 [Actinomycetota bacterium]
MSTPRKALVVTPSLERAGLWSGWLRSAGYMSLSCAGPGLTHDCPRLRGAICPLRQAVSLAVVDVNSDPSAQCCTILPDDGSTVSFRPVGSNRDQRSRLMGLVAAPRVGSVGSAVEPHRR